MSTDNERVPAGGQAPSPEKRADDIMRSVLGLTAAELVDVYRSQSSNDATQSLFELATKAAAEYQQRREPVPEHVHALLVAVLQKELPLEGIFLRWSVPKILLIDADCDRILNRRAVFESHKYRIEVAFTLAEAIAKLATETFQAVIVDWSRVAPEDVGALHEIQIWNLQVPIINVSAWSRTIAQDEHRFNWSLVRAIARALGRPMPRNLPKRKPMKQDSTKSDREDDLFGITG